MNADVLVISSCGAHRPQAAQKQPAKCTTARLAEANRRAPDAGAAEFVAGPENWLAGSVVANLLAQSEPAAPALPRLPLLGPLVLHGPTGTGKSQLAHMLAQTRPGAIYVHAADFARELSAAIDDDQAAGWREKYRGAEMLVLDDLELLEKRRTSQQELLHLLDDLEVQQRPVVITSRKAPSDMPRLAAGLRSRLAGGLVLRLAQAGAAARQVLIQRWADELNLALSPAAARHLAESLSGTVAEIRGTLLAFKRQLSQPARPAGTPVQDAVQPTTGRKVNSIGVDQMRRFLSRRNADRRPSMPQIIAAVAKHFGLPPATLSGSSRRRQVALARSMAAYLARRLTGKSLQELASHFGRRDHTTMLYACRSFQSRLSQDAGLRAAIDELQAELLRKAPLAH